VLLQPPDGRHVLDWGGYVDAHTGPVWPTRVYELSLTNRAWSPISADINGANRRVLPLGKVAMASPPEPSNPPGLANFTLSVGSACLTATAVRERSALTLEPCAAHGRNQVWRNNSQGMLFLAAGGMFCAKPVGDCNRTLGTPAWLGDVCVIPAHIFALDGSKIRLPMDCNHSKGHMCLAPRAGEPRVALEPCAARASAQWVRTVMGTH
jgi:hypothetical protein